MQTADNELNMDPGYLGAKLHAHPGGSTTDCKFKNILLVAHSASKNIFGAERSFLDLLQGLSSAPVNVFVSLPRESPDYIELIKEHCCSVYVFKYDWWSALSIEDEQAIEAFGIILTINSIDLVHVNTIMVHDALIAARRCGVPSIVHVRELISQDEHLQNIIGCSSEAIINQTLAHADWIVGNSQVTSDCFHKPGRTFTLYNTIFGNELTELDNEVTGNVKFGLISSNLRKKGIEDFVIVACICYYRCPKAQFLLIGPDTELTHTLKAMQKNGEISPNIIFTGYAASPQAALRQVNVVLNLSHFGESFGRTVLEAMAAGRPVIAYAHGALPELIVEGATGYLVAVKDTSSVANCIEKICDDQQLLSQMGRKGREAFKNNFSSDKYSRRLNSIYYNILSNHAGQI